MSHSRSYSGWWSCGADIPCWTSAYSTDPDFAVGAIGITFLFFANFGFFFVAMQYMQLVLGYSPLTTAFALTPLALPIMALGATMHLYLPKIGLRVAVAVGLFLIGAGLFCLRFLEAGSTYFDLAWPMMITSCRHRLVRCTNHFGDHERRARREAGSRLGGQRRPREVGAAVGIAVAGSALAAQYSSVLAPALTGFPEQIRAGALESLANALAIAEEMGPQGARLADLATSAFIDSMSLSLLVLAIVLALAAAFVAIWAPGRDGRQSSVVRRIKARRSISDDELGGPVTEHDDGGVRAPAGDGGKHRAVDHP